MYSSDFVREIGLEIRDVMPEAEDLLYAFIDVPSRLTDSRLRELIQSVGLTSASEVARGLDILLWYGFLGLVRSDGEVDYIYSLNYDMRLLKAKIRHGAVGAVYAIHSAFWPGLGISA